MGLDMYLFKKVYVKRWDFDPHKYEFTVKREGKPSEINPDKLFEVTEEVMYWRKVNAIHNWFVQNVQKGVDDCYFHHVSPDKLKEFVDVCTKVLENRTLAEKLLPPTEGFFFGSNNIDEWYWKNLEETVEVLKPIAEEYSNGSEYEIYYQSSW